MFLTGCACERQDLKVTEAGSEEQTSDTDDPGKETGEEPEPDTGEEPEPDSGEKFVPNTGEEPGPDTGDQPAETEESEPPEVLDYSVTAPNLFGYRIGDRLNPEDFTGVAILPKDAPRDPDRFYFEPVDAAGTLMTPVTVLSVKPERIPSERFQAEVTLEGLGGERIVRQVNCRLFVFADESSEEKGDDPGEETSEVKPNVTPTAVPTPIPTLPPAVTPTAVPTLTPTPVPDVTEGETKAAFDAYRVSRAAFDRINEYRKEQGLEVICWDEGVYRLLLIRLSEIEKDYSHREYFAEEVGSFLLNGRSYGFHTGSECIAWTRPDEVSAVNDWKNSPAHDRILLTEGAGENFCGAVAVGETGKAVFTVMDIDPRYQATMQECWDLYDSGEWEEHVDR